MGTWVKKLRRLRKRYQKLLNEPEERRKRARTLPPIAASLCRSMLNTKMIIASDFILQDRCAKRIKFYENRMRIHA